MTELSTAPLPPQSPNQQTELHVPYKRIHGEDVKYGKTEEAGFDAESFNRQFGAPALKGYLGDSLAEAIPRHEENQNPSEISKQLDEVSPGFSDSVREKYAKEVLQRQKDQASGKAGGFLGASNAPSMHPVLGGPKMETTLSAVPLTNEPAANQQVENSYDDLFNPDFDTSDNTVEGAAVRPEGYPIVTDQAELARRNANVAAAVRQGRVDDGKAPFVMPH